MSELTNEIAWLLLGIAENHGRARLECKKTHGFLCWRVVVRDDTDWPWSESLNTALDMARRYWNVGLPPSGWEP